LGIKEVIETNSSWSINVEKIQKLVGEDKKAYLG
jgi:hypothetical protein